MTSAEILVEDFNRLRSPAKEEQGVSLETEITRRGVRHQQHPPARDPRDRFIHAAATVSVYRLQLAKEKDNFRSAKVAYERARDAALPLQLKARDLKTEVRRLRSRMRSLESQLRGRGVDPDEIEPRMDVGAVTGLGGSQGGEGSPSPPDVSAVEWFRRGWTDT
jgi:hypothetical protein